jgi:6-phosphogluconolactonase
MELIVAPIAELRPKMTRLFEHLLEAELSGRRTHPFACALTGGSTALIFLGALREAAVDWSRVRLFWGDERAVDPDHPDSNYGLAEKLLLSPLGGRAPIARRMPAEMEDLDAAARAYETTLAAELGPKSRSSAALDLLILGTGDDGHVCSLFPGHPALKVEDRWVVGIRDSPKPPPARLSLTMPFVLRSRQVWVVIVGPRKLPVLQHALSREPAATPLDTVVRQAKHVTIFTDQTVGVSRNP